jgi:hypothetical protein
MHLNGLKSHDLQYGMVLNCVSLFLCMRNIKIFSKKVLKNVLIIGTFFDIEKRQRCMNSSIMF